jgi:hypothetical protein
MRWNRRDPDGWHRWFAWHPVEIMEEGICAETVWLEMIERRTRRQPAANENPYEYRNINRSPY